MSGAVLLLPERVAERVTELDLTVTPAGRVYDRGRQRYVEGAEVVEVPAAQRAQPGAAPARRRRRTSRS